MNKSTYSIIGVIIAVIIGSISWAVSYQFSYQFFSGGSVETQMAKAAAEMNKTLPKMGDPETRLDKVVAGPGKNFHYHYTIVNHVKNEPIIKQMQEPMRQQVTTGYKNNTGLKAFRDAGVSLNYHYVDKNNESLFDFIVGPKD